MSRSLLLICMFESKSLTYANVWKLNLFVFFIIAGIIGVEIELENLKVLLRVPSSSRRIIIMSFCYSMWILEDFRNFVCRSLKISASCNCVIFVRLPLKPIRNCRTINVSFRTGIIFSIFITWPQRELGVHILFSSIPRFFQQKYLENSNIFCIFKKLSAKLTHLAKFDKVRLSLNYFQRHNIFMILCLKKIEICSNVGV